MAEYFRIHLNKESDKELITWLLRNRDIFESPPFAARRELYICMEKMKRRRSEKQIAAGRKRGGQNE